jgi:hypothetical protein
LGEFNFPDDDNNEMLYVTDLIMACAVDNSLGEK